MKSHSII